MSRLRWPPRFRIYTLFSLAPLLTIAIAMAGLFFGQEAAQNQVVETTRGLIGKETAQAIQEMIESAGEKPAAGIISTLFGVIALLFGGAEALVHGLDLLVSFAFITLLFALIYKFLPDARIRWKDVWIGAVFTSLLFTIGKSLIGLYLGNSGATSVYGAAGSLITVLLWVYYSALIFFFGAELTRVSQPNTAPVWRPPITRGWSTPRRLRRRSGNPRALDEAGGANWLAPARTRDTSVPKLTRFAKPPVLGRLELLAELLQLARVHQLADFGEHHLFLFFFRMMLDVVRQHFELGFELFTGRTEPGHLAQQGLYLLVLLDRFQGHLL
jgi:Virulence factor BrkB